MELEWFTVSKDPSTEMKSSDQSGQILQFVPIQKPNQASDPAVRKVVRQHAMRDFRRRTKKRREDRYLDVTSLLSSAKTASRGDGERALTRSSGFLQELVTPSASSSLNTNIAASPIDPFVPLPMKPSPRTKELFHHLFENSCVMFKTMRNLGFFTIMMGSAGFQQALASSAWHQAWLRGQEIQNIEYLPHQIAAVQCLKDRLIHPIISINDETIALVVAFACQAIMTADIAAWSIHIDGLEKMIRERGGMSALSDKLLRLMLHWVDVSGACNLDITPRFPIPVELSPKPELPSESPSQSQLDPSNTISEGGMKAEVLSILHTLNKAIVAELALRDLWSDPVWLVFNLTPLFHRLLPSPGRAVSGRNFQEVCRLAAILYLREAQRKFGVTTTSAVVYIAKLQSVINMSQQVCSEDAGIFLWVLVMGGITSTSTSRSWFSQRVVSLLRDHGIGTWEEATNSIPQSLWIREVLEAGSSSFGVEVMQALSA